MIHAILTRTFGGLSRPYFIRQFLFGLIFPAAIVFLSTFSHETRFSAMPASFVFSVVVNTLLYPYARFVYEGIARYVIGDNWFYMPMLRFVFLKVLTMVICWSLAIVIAPVGLVYLYFRNSRG